MSFVHRLFGRAREREALLPLYEALVREARDPAWYRDGTVPDTLEGRFDMVASVLALVLLRLEAEGEAARRESVLLTEIFIDDMDASLRELGTGDMMVGKKVGKLVGALGGRLGSFRDSAGFEAAVRRNVFRDDHERLGHDPSSSVGGMTGTSRCEPCSPPRWIAALEGG